MDHWITVAANLGLREVAELLGSVPKAGGSLEPRAISVALNRFALASVAEMRCLWQ